MGETIVAGEVKKHLPVLFGQLLELVDSGQQKVDGMVVLHCAAQILQQLRLDSPFLDLIFQHLEFVDQNDEFAIYLTGFHLIEEEIEGEGRIAGKVALIRLRRGISSLRQGLGDIESQVIEKLAGANLKGFALHIDKDGNMLVQRRGVCQVEQERRFAHAPLPIEQQNCLRGGAREIIAQRVNILIPAKKQILRGSAG